MRKLFLLFIFCSLIFGRPNPWWTVIVDDIPLDSLFDWTDSLTAVAPVPVISVFAKIADSSRTAHLADSAAHADSADHADHATTADSAGVADTCLFYPDDSVYAQCTAGTTSCEIWIHNGDTIFLDTLSPGRFDCDSMWYCLDGTLSFYLPLSGGTMSGDIDMGDHSILNADSINTDGGILYIGSSISITGRSLIDSIYHVYGGFADSTVTIDLTKDVWAQVTNTGFALFVGDEVDGFSLSGDTMTVLFTGDFWGTTVLTFSGSAQKEYQIRLYNITQAQQEGYLQGLSGNGAGNYVQITLPIYSEATLNDRYIVQVQNISGNEDIILRHAQFILTYLHD